jgi:hypothetical protein
MVDFDVDVNIDTETVIQPQAYERMQAGGNERILHHDVQCPL